MGTILVFDQMASILYDSRSTYSYVSVQFAMGQNLGDVLDYLIHVPTLI